MSNRYKRIHTPAPKYQKWIAGVTEYIHTKDLLAGYLVRMETPYHFLLYYLKQIKELKSQLQNFQNVQDVATILEVLLCVYVNIK